MAGATPPGNVRMEPEIIIGALAIFVSGGAMGAAGMLLCQWVLGRLSPPSKEHLKLGGARDIEAMRADLADLAARLHSVDARLDFTEELLGGALSGSRPPESLPPPQSLPAKGDGALDADASSVGGGISLGAEGSSPGAESGSPDFEDDGSEEKSASL